MSPWSRQTSATGSFGYSAVSAPPSPPLHGADPNSRDRWYGQTALMWAAAAGRVDVARLLINAGADVNVVDVEGSTALMFASSNGHLILAEMLLDRGADIGIANRAGDTALHGQPKVEVNTADLDQQISEYRAKYQKELFDKGHPDHARHVAAYNKLFQLRFPEQPK